MSMLILSHLANIPHQSLTNFNLRNIPNVDVHILKHLPLLLNLIVIILTKWLLR